LLGAHQKEVFTVSTNRAPIMKAVAMVRQEIGLDPEPKPEAESKPKAEQGSLPEEALDMKIVE